MAPVNELSARVKRIYAVQENVQKRFKGYCRFVIVDGDGFPVAGALVLHILICGVDLPATGVAADYLGDTRHFGKNRGDAPEAAPGKIGGFHFVFSFWLSR